MKIEIITLFPEFFESLKTHSIVGRAMRSGLIEVRTHNLRDWAVDTYGTVDDRPYGGGVGMVLKVDVLHRALTSVREKLAVEKPGTVTTTILLTPQGQVYKQAKALELAKSDNLILIAGHYEGFDERIREYVDLELSVGDYILTGGEIPAMLVTDSVARLIPGVLGDDISSVEESHTDNLLEYPQYTRPPSYEGRNVPEILLSGNHPEIEKWRKNQAKARTKLRRPDLLKTE